MLVTLTTASNVIFAPDGNSRTNFVSQSAPVFHASSEAYLFPGSLGQSFPDNDTVNALPVLMEGRQIYQHKAVEAHLPLCAAPGRFSLDTAAPILSEGDVLGWSSVGSI